MGKCTVVFAALAVAFSTNSATSSAQTYSFEDNLAPTLTTAAAPATATSERSYWETTSPQTYWVSTTTDTATTAPSTAPATETAAPSTDTVTPTVETTAPSTAAATAAPTNVAIVIDPTAAATSTIESTYINWVGSALGTAKDSACYREAHVASTCPLGFESTLETCWAECPLAYPVECGMECIRQSDDCALEVLTKVAVVAQAALTAATLGVFGEFKVMAQAVQVGVKCAKEMIGLVKSLAKYIRNIQVSNPQTSQDQLLALLYQSDNVIIDLPATVCTCLGIKVPDKVKYTDKVLTTAELVLKEVVTNANAIVSSWASFTTFLTNVTLFDSVQSLNQTDISSLQMALASNSSCGYDMKRLTDRTWMAVADLRRQTPDISEDDIRVAVSQSDLVLNEIPTVTNNCMEELIAQSDKATAFTTRDTLRKTLGVVLDDLISSGTSDNGTFLSTEEYAYVVADKGLTAYAIWDPTGLAGVMAEYLQTICGPTKFVGEIDDGTAEEALGLSMVGDAFNNSAGSWTKAGDGAVTISFQSVDTEDVTVNINSGGNDVAKVAVAAGETVTWSSNMTALGGKTLYLDRWRPGFLGLPGTGGGSLLLWVPRSTQGGNLQLTAMLNQS